MSVLALVGATVLPVSSDPIGDGVILVDGGRILAVGPRAEVPIPDGAEVVDLTGHTVIPGLVDTHSHIGSTGDLNERSGPLQITVSAIDAIDARHPSIALARAGGITTANVMPGSGNLIGGQTAYIKLRDADTVDELLTCADRTKDVCGGLKMANGTNPQGQGAYPRTRMGAASQVRNRFEAAQRKLASQPAPSSKRKAPSPPPVDPEDRILFQVLKGERTVHFHTHRADDVATILSLARQFGFTPVLHHVSEAWKVVDLIAESGVPCSLILIDSPGGKEEATEIRMENAALLAARGVHVAIHTDDPITDSRLFLRSGALAVRAGLPEDAALAALTLEGARMLGLDDRVGSIEPGKDADLVVLSGAPFSTWTHVEQTWVEGELLYDRSRPEDTRFERGGWAVPDRGITP